MISHKRPLEIVDPSYKPSKEELEENFKVEATFDQIVDAMVAPAEIVRLPRPKKPLSKSGT